MKIKKDYLILLIFLIAIAFRLYFSFQTAEYSDSRTFFHITNIEHIKETYKPVNYDHLSFGERQIKQAPIFDYLLAGLSFIPYAYKIVPAILISLSVIISYFLALKLTLDKTAALLSALMVAFLPSVIVPTLNKISVFSLILPMILYMIYCLIRIEEKKFLNQFIILCFALPIIHPWALLVSVSFFIYIILIVAEPNLKLNLLRKEAIIFSIFLVLLIEFILYKKAFLSLGFSIIWQNIPAQMLAEHFKEANLWEIIYSVGVIPFILGIIGIVFGITRDKTHSGLIVISVAVSSMVLLSLRLLNLEDALILLGPILAIMSVISLKKFFQYLKLTKFSKYEKASKYLIFILITLTIIIPTYSTAKKVLGNTITEDEIDLLRMLNEETDKNAIIASSAEEGHYITYFAKRKNVIHEKFLYISSIELRYNNIKTLYQTISGSEALEIAHKYGINYIYLSPRTKKIFGIKDLPYTTNEKCFRKIASSGEVEAYKIRC